MLLTYAGYVAAIVLIIILIKIKCRIYIYPTLPLAMICIMFLKFYGSYNDTIFSLKSDILLFISFCLFILSYSYSFKKKYKKPVSFLESLINKKNTGGELIVKNSFFWGYVLFVGLYICFDLYVNIKIYGSIQDAMTRFYVKPTLEDIPSFFINIQGFFFKAIIAFLFVFRFFQNVKRKKNNWIYLPTLLLCLIAFPKGSRGAVVAPFMMLFLADIFYIRFYVKQVSLFFFKRFVEYFYIILSCVVLFLSLTTIRGIEFTDIQDVSIALKEIKISESTENYNESEGNLMIDDLEFTLSTFGDKISFLPITYSLTTVLLNPIPRFFYTEKPVGFGTVLTEAKFGSNNFEVSNLIKWKTSFAVGVAGEGWANGGLLGLVFYSILMGLYSGFFSKLYYSFIWRDNYLSVILALLFFQASYNFIRGDLLSGITQAVYPILIIIIFIIFFYRR